MTYFDVLTIMANKRLTKYGMTKKLSWYKFLDKNKNKFNCLVCNKIFNRTEDNSLSFEYIIDNHAFNHIKKYNLKAFL